MRRGARARLPRCRGSLSTARRGASRRQGRTRRIGTARGRRSRSRAGTCCSADWPRPQPRWAGDGAQERSHLGAVKPGGRDQPTAERRRRFAGVERREDEEPASTPASTPGGRLVAEKLAMWYIQQPGGSSTWGRRHRPIRDGSPKRVRRPRTPGRTPRHRTSQWLHHQQARAPLARSLEPVLALLALLVGRTFGVAANHAGVEQGPLARVQRELRPMRARRPASAPRST